MPQSFDVIYRSRVTRALRLGLLVIVMGTGCGWLAWFLAEIMDNLTAAVALAPIAAMLIGLGLVVMIGGCLGLPKVMLSEGQLSVRSISGTTFATWTSIGQFDILNHGTAFSAPVIGSEVDARTGKNGKIVVPAGSLTIPADVLLQEMMERRARALQRS